MLLRERLVVTFKEGASKAAKARFVRRFGDGDSKTSKVGIPAVNVPANTSRAKVLQSGVVCNATIIQQPRLGLRCSTSPRPAPYRR